MRDIAKIASTIVALDIGGIGNGENEKFEVLRSKTEGIRNALTDKVVQTFNKNDGGKLDFPDISVIKESMGQTVEKGKETVKEATRQLELKAFQPIFSESLEEVDFLMPKFIRVVERDKKYLESEVKNESRRYLEYDIEF